jgi:hypothetical protein
VNDFGSDTGAGGGFGRVGGKAAAIRAARPEYFDLSHVVLLVRPSGRADSFHDRAEARSVCVEGGRLRLGHWPAAAAQLTRTLNM